MQIAPMAQRKTLVRETDEGLGIKPLAVTYSCMTDVTLPSAQARFTAEFGMGSGGTTPLWPPGKGCEQRVSAGSA